MFDSGQLFINSVDKTTTISDPSSFSWSATRGARGDCSIPLRLFEDDPYSPELGDLLEIYDPPVGQPGATRVWIGTVEDYDEDFQDNDGLRIASIKGVTLHQMFDTQPCPEVAFDGASAATIFSALFGAGVYPVTVTLGTVDAGETITRNYDPKTYIGSAFGQLATDSNGYWDIDPRTTPPQVNFIVTSIPSAGFTLHDDNIVFGTNKYRQSRSDFRDRQIIQAPPGVAGSLNATFVGDGSTTEFALPSIPNQLSSVSNTNSSQATGTGTFTAQPADGDTITIAGIAYTFKNTIDNSVARQIKIAATLAVTGQNFTDAINLTPATSGTGYSSPTQVNGVVTAAWDGTDTITVTAVSTGSLGNGVVLAESCATFSWASAVTSGGVTGQLAGLSFGSYAAGNFDVLWTPGSPTLTFAVAPAVGINVIVVYTGVMSSFPSVSNNAAAGLGIGSQTQIMTARNAAEYAQVVQQAGAVLAGRSVIPGEYRFTSDDCGYFTGDGLDVDLTEPPQLVAKVNGQPWIEQDISAEWIEGMENATAAGYGHFRYNVHMVNTMAYTSYQQTLQRLVDNPLRALPGADLNPPNEGPGGGFARVVYWERLVLADSTVMDDAMPSVTVALPQLAESPLNFMVGIGIRVLAVLSVTISADLTVRFNKITAGSPVSTVSWTVTIPNGTPVDEVVVTPIEDIEFFEGDVIKGDVIDSDGQTIAIAPWGIATFQIVWAA